MARLAFFSLAIAFLAIALIQQNSFAATIQLAITVDDLPRHGTPPQGISPEIIAENFITVFKNHRVPEVYGFLNGERLQRDVKLQNVVRSWMNAGFRLGNHTYNHPNLSKTSADDFNASIDLNEPFLRQFSPDSDYHWFRFPFLSEGESIAKRNAVRLHLASKNYRVAETTINFEDWAWNDPYSRCLNQNNAATIAWLEESYLSAAKSQLNRSIIMANKLFGREIKQVLLLHLGAFDALMLDRLLGMFEGMGVSFVTLDNALSDPVFSLDPAFATTQGMTFLKQMMAARGLPLPPSDPIPNEQLAAACR